MKNFQKESVDVGRRWGWHGKVMVRDMAMEEVAFKPGYRVGYRKGEGRLGLRDSCPGTGALGQERDRNGEGSNFSLSSLLRNDSSSPVSLAGESLTSTPTP